VHSIAIDVKGQAKKTRQSVNNGKGISAEALLLGTMTLLIGTKTLLTVATALLTSVEVTSWLLQKEKKLGAMLHEGTTLPGCPEQWDKVLELPISIFNTQMTSELPRQRSKTPEEMSFPPMGGLHRASSLPRTLQFCGVPALRYWRAKTLQSRLSVQFARHD
uniref:Uncharacterized protein n=1 Tax=Romanomermis culicivorax TaxID=13658 RepID=A0A915KB64_ROMCU